MGSLVDKVRGIHKNRFGVDPAVTSFAPARVEVLGNHTDYNHGTALSFAIDSGVAVSLSPSEKAGVCVYGADVDETCEFSTPPQNGHSGPPWADYFRGVVSQLKIRGIHADELNCTFAGSVPAGGGLSSSAAIEVAFADALIHHVGAHFSKLDVARICRDAESAFAGTSCGLLDPLTSIYGQKDALLHIDFQTSTVRPLKWPRHMTFLIVDTGTSHSLWESEYNSRRKSCENAAARLGQLLGRNVRFLRDVRVEEFLDRKEELSSWEARCASHVLYEIQRVARGVESIATGDFRTFGELMFASHLSSQNDFENSCEALDTAVASARSAGALGARLTGGGFGGNAIVLTAESQVESLAGQMERDLLKAGIQSRVERVIPSAGARIENLSA